MRRLLSLILCVAAAGGVYLYMRESNSARIKREVLKATDEMNLSSDQRADVRRYIDAEHETAYRNALNLANDIGGQFDSQGYFDELFAAVVDRARSEGSNDLADKVAEEKSGLSFTVTER